nr:MAG TPA: hypothetical protein [Caudoviricetes sp.]
MTESFRFLRSGVPIPLFYQVGIIYSTSIIWISTHSIHYSFSIYIIDLYTFFTNSRDLGVRVKNAFWGKTQKLTAPTYCFY